MTSVKTSDPTMLTSINVYDKDMFYVTETPISLQSKKIRDIYLITKNYTFH
jgi:hypothetical protein